jgi:hypothetical protein
MRKIILFLLFITMLQSCEKEVQFNNPAMQSRIDSDFWKANQISASKNSSGGATITGVGATGNMVLKTSSLAKGVYTLGTTNTQNFASFTLLNNTNSFNCVTNPFLAPVNKVRILSGGTGYSDSLLVSTTGGTGFGLKFSISTSNGVVTTATANIPGDGYFPGDVVTVSAGGSNANLLVENTSLSNGTIEITEYDGVTISGNFKFTAYDELVDKIAIVRDGVFYKVPVN